MKRVLFIVFAVALTSSISYVCAAEQDPEITAKHVRKFINKGNKSYRNGDYAEAETSFRDALQENPNSALAKFNLALTLLKQQTANSAQSDTLKLMSKSYFQNVAGSSTADPSLREKSYYNLGNIAFGEEDYAGSIEMYKEVLRMNPENIAARQNLRVAQIKLKDQQSNQGKDKDQDQKQEQNKDQQQEQQQQQNEQKNQNQQQQQQEDKKENDQRNGAQNNSNQQPQEKNKNEGVAAGRPQISKENADKILKAAAKQEEQTRKKVENQQKDNTKRTIIGNPW